MSLLYREVTSGRQGVVALLTVLVVQVVLSSFVLAETYIIPSLTVSETYDSNVFYTPKSLLGPGIRADDFSTTATPQINVVHAGSLIRGGLVVGGLVTKYIHNPSLDYTGINAGGRLDLKDTANKLSQRITTLMVTGAYQFTPSLSGFGATGGGLGNGYGATSGGAFDSGLVTNRVSMNSYNLGVTGGYQLTRTTTLTGGYNFTRISFGRQSGGQNNQLFDTTGHQGSTTISTQVSATDSVGATAGISHYTQGQSGGGGQGSFTTITETLNWSRLWTQRLSTMLSGGGIVTLPIESPFPGQSVKAQFAPTATAAINYASYSEGLRAAGSSPGPFDGLPSIAGTLSPGGISAPGQFTTSLRYNFSLFPSYAFGAGPIKVHGIGMNVTGGITAKLTAQAGLNFSHGSSGSPPSTFDSAGVTGGLRYLMGPVLANLTYNWLYFSNSTSQPQVAQSEYAFSKKMIMLSFSYAFTSQSFFQMDRFGWAGGPGPGGGSTGGSTSESGSGVPVPGLGN